MKQISTPAMVNITFISGMCSIILWPLSIVPIVAIVAGIITIMRYNKLVDKDGLGYTILGLVLGVVFLIVRIMS